jgi:hypothetical protein
MRVAEERGVSLTANLTSAALKTSERAHEDAEHDEDDETGPVDHAGLRQHPPNRSEHRFGRLDQEGRDLIAPSRIDPGHEHPAEDEHPQRNQQELEEVDEERGTHGSESTKRTG